MGRGLSEPIENRGESHNPKFAGLNEAEVRQRKHLEKTRDVPSLSLTSLELSWSLLRRQS